MSFSKPFSEKTNEVIDAEIKKIVEEAYKRAVDILKKNKEGLIKLAQQLLDKEVIFGDDLEKIFGKRPWGSAEDKMDEMENLLAEKEKKETKKKGEDQTSEVKEKAEDANEKTPEDSKDSDNKKGQTKDSEDTSSV
jgi:cell division protease FtsH